MTVCGIVNLSENIARGVFNNKPNLISRYKVTGIDNALRNLGIEMGLSTKNFCHKKTYNLDGPCHYWHDLRK